MLCAISAKAAPREESLLAGLMREPTPAEWQALTNYDGTVTRAEFEEALANVFDPWRGLRPYLQIGAAAVAVYRDAARRGTPLVVVHFAPTWHARRKSVLPFRAPETWVSQSAVESAKPLAGLRVAIEPADIGGVWAKMEDRSVEFHGYGRISEGDLNLIVGRLLRDRLSDLGADVFLVRNRAEPVLPIAQDHLLATTEAMLSRKPALLPEPFQRRAIELRKENRARLQFAAGLFLTKTLETAARAALVRRSFQPDITLVIQHDATPASTEGKLTPINRNIFFVEGAYLPDELQDSHQRLRLLTKLFQRVTSIETTVAVAIARRFQTATGFPAVLYGNSATTREVVAHNEYVVARNLAMNREHDGPVVVTEPYFMNQPETLARLLVGDYVGRRRIAGRDQVSIFREYADCVAGGLIDAYARDPRRSSRRDKQ
ncbi:MAG TPA: hypothetical protein VHE61_07705 [Opitutaceae bacterium]|nr:hypothetical protein [Opitutaceae bacterium]